MERAIIHSDLNCFYASVEMMLNPVLKNKAVAVCGSTEERHGIVLAKSELAKKCGVKTGMANWEAMRCCKDLIIVPPQYEQYLKYSKLAQAIYQRYTDLVEPFGMDECWLDVTDSGIYGDGMAIAEKIRTSMREELGLTVSIGVSFNKIFAKLGSDMKKPDAITEITRENFKEKVWNLPASDMIYVGHATTKKLGSYCIRTIGDIANTNPDFLQRRLGVNGIKLWQFANGEDISRVMQKDFVSPVKSIGHGITCVTDLNNYEEVKAVILELSQDVSHRLRVHELSAGAVQITVKGYDLLSSQYQCKLPFYTQLSTEIAASAAKLFKEHYITGSKVRAITVRVIDLIPKGMPQQVSMFVNIYKFNSREQLEDTVDRLRQRFGKRAVTYASLLTDLKMPPADKNLVRMPGMMYM